MRSYSDYKKYQPAETENAFSAARAGNCAYFMKNNTLIPEMLKRRDNKGYSVFMLACYYGHRELVRLLLGAGANPNDADDGGNSVLMGAAFKGLTDILETLIAAGADPQQKNDKGLTAASFAQMFGRGEALVLLNPNAQLGLAAKIKVWIQFFNKKPKHERTNNV